MARGRGIRAGRAFVELGTDDSAFNRGLRRASNRLKAFGKATERIGASALRASALILAPLGAATKLFASMGDQVAKMSLRTGVGVEALSEIGFAAEQSGANIEVFEKGLRTMQRTINDATRGLTTATDAFKDLGVSVEDFQTLAPEAQFKLLADRISQIADPSKRAALAMQIMGRAGTQLLPLMRNGARGIEALQAEARSMGLTISTQSAEAAAEFTDRMNSLFRVVKVAAFEIGAALVPQLIELSKTLQAVATASTQWIRANQGTLQSVASVTTKVAAGSVVALVMGKAFRFLAAVGRKIIPVFTGIKAAAVFVTTSFGAIAAGAAILAGAFALPVAAIAAVIALVKDERKVVDELEDSLNDLTRKLDQSAAAQKRETKALKEATAARKEATKAAREAANAVARATGDEAGKNLAKLIEQQRLRNASALEKEIALIKKEAAAEKELLDAIVKGIRAKGEATGTMSPQEGGRLQQASFALQLLPADTEAKIAAARAKVRRRDFEAFRAGEKAKAAIALGEERALQFEIASIKANAIENVADREDESRRINRIREVDEAQRGGAGQKVIDLITRKHDLLQRIADLSGRPSGGLGATTAGTFSAERIGATLGRGDQAIEKATLRTATAAEETAANTKTIADRIGPAPTFG